MALTHIISEVWAKALLANLERSLVYGQKGVVNRDYEGEIRQQGDTVHITSLVTPTVRPYVKGTALTWDEVSDTGTDLLIDQGQYFAFKSHDLDRKQASAEYVTTATSEAANNLKMVADSFIGTTMAADVAAGNQLGAVTLASPADAYDLLVELRAILTKANVPDAGRWTVVPTDMYSLLLKDDRFVDSAKAGTDTGLRNGKVGSAAGFTILEAQSVPYAAGAWSVLAGYPGATCYAEQILETETLRLQDHFADGVRGLHVYGAKVVRPTGIAAATVTIGTAETEG